MVSKFNIIHIFFINNLTSQSDLWGTTKVFFLDQIEMAVELVKATDPISHNSQ